MTTRRLAPGAPLRGSDDTGYSTVPRIGRTPADNGSVSAEFALVFPVLILLIFIMVTLASVFFDQLHLQAAARDAARAGVVDINGACAVAQTALTTNDIGNLTCLVVDDCSTGNVRVTLTAASTYSVPVLGTRNVSLSATSSFVCPQ